MPRENLAQPRLPRVFESGCRILTAFAFACLFFTPWASEAQSPRVVASDGSREIQRLEVGNDLFISLENFRPLTTYSLRLLDESQSLIVETSRKTDGTGAAELGLSPLWERTGIVGCDADDPADPTSFLYSDLDQADAFLGGRLFEIQVRQGQTDQLAASLPLPILAERTRPVFFFADFNGCPRQKFVEGEAIYMDARGLSSQQEDVLIVLLNHGSPLKPGDPMVEARDSSLGPQGVGLQPGQKEFFEVVWPSAEPGKYGGVVRLTRDDTMTFLQEDRWIGGYGDTADALPDSGPLASEFQNINDVSPHGLTVVPSDCASCPGVD